MSEKIINDPSAQIVPHPSHPGLKALGSVVWHGTRAEHLPSILENGLDPEKTKVGHTCLSTDPALALFYARIEQAFSRSERDDLRPILIAIPVDQLAIEDIAPETGTVDISAYGHKMPGRSKKDLAPLRDDWVAIVKSTSCLGYKGAITVDPGQVFDTNGDVIAEDDVFEEYNTGVVTNPSVKHWLKKLLPQALAA